MNSAGKDDILDPTQLHFEGDFNAQVENILYHVRLTASEVHNLRHLFIDLEKALQVLARGVKVRPFGSIVTGLGIKTSDVDCYVELPDGMQPSNNIVIHARNILRNFHTKFTNLFAITTAKVPIVKFLHIPTNCYCDINFKSPAGYYNSTLISHLLRMDRSDRALHLAVLIKYWSKVHRLTGTNWLASYALTLMVIFYLQLMGMLPSILEMQKNVPPIIIDGWNVEFCKENNYNVNNKDSLYDLIGGFFKCYSKLNLKSVIICPYMGRLLQKKMFSNLDEVPKEFVYYKENVTHNVHKPLRIDSPMCVQDPFEHCRNAAISVGDKLAARLMHHLQLASKMFDELPSYKFLQAILTPDQNEMSMFNLNKKPKQVFHNKVMKHKHVALQQKHGLTNKANLTKCYQQINRMKRTRMK